MIAFAGAWLGTRLEFRRHGTATAPVTIIIAKGTPTLEIGRHLQADGVIPSAWAFDVAVHVFRGKPLKAGEYRFPAHARLASIIAQMRAGQVIIHWLTIPEGLTNAQIAALIAAEPTLDGPIGTLPPEGQLMPETYSFTRSDSRAGMVQRMHETASKALEEAWQGRDKTIALASPEQALILASIVEKETGVASERPIVASVFYNRLAKDIPLQSDPTIIYAMSHGAGAIGRPLGHHDLGFESAYNTYLHTGLPPGPICNPGRAALNAVLHPAHDDYLYFVATGDGGHAFAATLEQHNRNVADYVKAMRERGR